ncbi:uncharacterized protein J3D65DRAFT_476638 [Phyllosticta citribraziliensis]|uniref:Uncharacterized protein n=1 Tax=Phyllosticta citribraziliensis TaxID=989973 RepID=A0ABR1LJW1_9PEZI
MLPAQRVGRNSQQASGGQGQARPLMSAERSEQSRRKHDTRLGRAGLGDVEASGSHDRSTRDMFQVEAGGNGVQSSPVDEAMSQLLMERRTRALVFVVPPGSCWKHMYVGLVVVQVERCSRHGVSGGRNNLGRPTVPSERMRRPRASRPLKRLNPTTTTEPLFSTIPETPSLAIQTPRRDGYGTTNTVSLWGETAQNRIETLCWNIGLR